MTVLSRAGQRSTFSLHRAALMFSNHINEHPRARNSWQAMIDEGTEPPVTGQVETMRLHVRHALKQRMAITAATTTQQEGPS
jgi:hypothetical protein